MLETPQPDARAVLLAASAGGLLAMREVLYGLPADFAVPIVCLQHLSDESSFVSLLQSGTGLPVRWAGDGDSWKRPGVTVCPPGQWLRAHPEGQLAVTSAGAGWTTSGPVDHTLGSFAQACGAGLLAVILTGAGTDGAQGVRAVREQRGEVLAQDAPRSMVWDMPRLAVETGCVDRLVPLQDIAPTLVHWRDEGTLPPQRVPPQAPSMLPGEESRWRGRTLALHRVLHRALEIQGAQCGNIQVFEPASNALEIVVQRGFGPEFLDRFRTVRVDDDSACGRAWRTRERVLVPDVEADPLFAPYSRLAIRSGFRSVQSTPLFGSGGKVVGMLSTHFAAARCFPPVELEHLDLQARSAGALLEFAFAPQER